ncbi:unnamed protein product [Cochlearia groenlandica]
MSQACIQTNWVKNQDSEQVETEGLKEDNQGVNTRNAGMGKSSNDNFWVSVGSIIVHDIPLKKKLSRYTITMAGGRSRVHRKQNSKHVVYCWWNKKMLPALKRASLTVKNTKVVISILDIVFVFQLAGQYKSLDTQHLGHVSAFQFLIGCIGLASKVSNKAIPHLSSVRTQKLYMDHGKLGQVLVLHHRFLSQSTPMQL